MPGERGPLSADPETYDRIHAILRGARALGGAQLEAYLEEVCGGDPALRARARQLHAASCDDGKADAFAARRIEGARLALEGVLASAAGEWLPERIGQYAIVRQLGRGGMGIVYEAEQASPRRRVAIKLLHPMLASGYRLRRFRQETVLLGRLQHPGIAQIYEAGTFDVGLGQQPFFAMELVDGDDLRAHCERNRLDRAARVEYLARVADAVQFAHEHGVIHRDLKPDNVLVDGHGNPRVLDFGVARFESASATLSSTMTEEGQLVGTLAYIAPEQFDQASDAVTPQLDVYSLGVLGFELLVGRLPHEVGGLPLSRAIALLANREAPRAGRLDASLRGDLETILAKALESEPSRRYASAAALADDLRRYLAHRPIQARPPSRVYLARKFVRRHRGLVAGTLANLLTLVAGSATILVLARQVEEQRELARAHQARANVQEALARGPLLQASPALLAAGQDRDVVGRHDGRFVAVQAEIDAHLGGTRSGAPLELFGTGAALPDEPGFLRFQDTGGGEAVVSPSGRRIALVSDHAQPTVIELGPGAKGPGFRPRFLELRGHANAVAAGPTWVHHLAVSNDSSLIASAAPLDPRIRVWDTRTGEEIASLERRCDEPGSWNALLAFTPDDERLLVTTPLGGRGPRLVEWDLASGDVSVHGDGLQEGVSHLELLDAFLDALGPLPPGVRPRLSQRVQVLDDRALAACFQETSGLPREREARGLAEGRRWRFLPGLPTASPGLGVHPTERRAAVVHFPPRFAARAGRLTVIDTERGEAVLERDLDHQPWCVTYSPDGAQLALGTNGGNVLLFETRYHSQQLSWRAHASPVHAIAWTPDGTRLATASGDGTVRLWDARPQVAAALANERWRALRSGLAGRDDLEEIYSRLAGEERQAARIERVLRKPRVELAALTRGR